MCISPPSNRSTSPRPVASSSSSSVEDNSNIDSHHAAMEHQRKGSSRRRATHTQDRRNNHRYIIANHNYHDHASDCPATSSLTATDSLLPIEQRGSSRSSFSFPIKLYDMLAHVEKDGYENIVSWQPHGRCFVIHQSKSFQQDLLPRYFGGLSKMASFQRQLNLYGFMRLSRGPDKGGYYHELFLQGKPFLVHRIQRIKVKGTGVRARSNPDQEPDFWNSMPWVGSEGTSTVSTTTTGAPTKSLPQPVQQKLSKPRPQVHSSKPAVLPPSSDSAASVVSHDCPTEGTLQQVHQEQSLPATIRTYSSVVTRSYSPPTNQVLCHHYLPHPLRPESPFAAQPQATAVARPGGQQLFLNRVVEPLRHHHNNNSRFSLASSDDEEESFHNSSDDDRNLVVISGWGKPFYLLGAQPKPEDKSAATSSSSFQKLSAVAMPQQQQQQQLQHQTPPTSSHRPLPPAPRMFISKLTSPPPPLTASLALELDALDFFMDDVFLESNHDEEQQRRRQSQQQQQHGYNYTMQDDSSFAKMMIQRIIE